MFKNFQVLWSYMVGHLKWAYLIRRVSADVGHDGIGNQLVFLKNPNKAEVVAVREASEKLLDESPRNVSGAKKAKLKLRSW